MPLTHSELRRRIREFQDQFFTQPPPQVLAALQGPSTSWWGLELPTALSALACRRWYVWA